MRQPAALERAEDSMRGVEIHGLGRPCDAMVPVSKRVIVLEGCYSFTGIYMECRRLMIADRSSVRLGEACRMRSPPQVETRHT